LIEENGLKPGKHQRKNKQAKIYVERSLNLHIFCLYWLVVLAHITSFVFRKGQPQYSQQHTTKTFAIFLNHFPQKRLMAQWRRRSDCQVFSESDWQNIVMFSGNKCLFAS